MAMKTAAMVLSSLVLGLEGAVLCPKGYCLKQIAVGTNADAFSCERYPAGYQCAAEGDECKCAGEVKYGNFKSTFQGKSSEEKWVTKKVAEKIMCEEKSFGSNPVPGMSTWCWCSPSSSPTGGARDTKPASSAAKAGYEAPKCLVFGIGMKVTSPPLPLETLFSMGVNQAVVNILYEEVFASLWKTGNMQILSFDAKTFASDIKVPCLDSKACLGSVEKAAAKVMCWRKDSKELKDYAVKYMTDNPKKFAELAKIATMGLDFNFFPKEMKGGSGPACAAPGPAPSPGGKKSTTKSAGGVTTAAPAPAPAGEDTGAEEISSARAAKSIIFATTIAVAAGCHAWLQ